MSDRRQQAGESAALWERAPHHLAYRACRENMIGLLEAQPEKADLIVPACPEWTVRDLLAHVVGNCRSSSEPFSRRPVAALSLRELLDEWSETGAALEKQLQAGGGRGYDVMVMDTYTHELDLRRVLESPPPADHPAYPNALGLLLSGFSGSVYARGLPALRIETEGAHWVVGPGPAAATVCANRHDLYRSFAGRRSHKQIAGLSWNTAPEKWLPAFTWGPFHPPAQATEDVIGSDACP